MARRTPGPDECVSRLIEEAQIALRRRRLLLHAKSVDNNSTHPVHQHMNTYPEIPFVITAKDMGVIDKLKLFPNPPSPSHPWTPWEKLLYAALWKEGKLESIKRIIEGAESAISKRESPPDNAIVYHYFGRHLTDPLMEPLVDQHSVRAYRLLVNSDPQKVEGIRASQQATAGDAAQYRSWFRELLREEKIAQYSSARTVDRFLFGLGAYSKLEISRRTITHRRTSQGSAIALGAICITPTARACYECVKLDCASPRNIGIIEPNGYLNIKQTLKDMLDMAHAHSPGTLSFHPATGTTATHGVGGSGYVSWYKFASRSDAGLYLARWFAVTRC